MGVWPGIKVIFDSRSQIPAGGRRARTAWGWSQDASFDSPGVGDGFLQVSSYLSGVSFDSLTAGVNLLPVSDDFATARSDSPIESADCPNASNHSPDARLDCLTASDDPAHGRDNSVHVSCDSLPASHGISCVRLDISSAAFVSPPATVGSAALTILSSRFTIHSRSAGDVFPLATLH